MVTKFKDIDGVALEFILIHYLTTEGLLDEFVIACHQQDILEARIIDSIIWGETDEGHEFWSNHQDIFSMFKQEFIQQKLPYVPPNHKTDERVII